MWICAFVHDSDIFSDAFPTYGVCLNIHVHSVHPASHMPEGVVQWLQVKIRLYASYVESETNYKKNKK